MNRSHCSWNNYNMILSCFLLVTTSLLLSSSYYPGGGGGRLVSFAQAKEIEVTNEWTKLGENDTIPAGMHVRMDMTTGEKWVKTIDENDDQDGDGGTTKATIDTTSSGVAVASVSADGNVETTITSSSTTTTSENGSKGEGEKGEEEPNYDYEMMHRTLSNLPKEEQERMGGIPELPYGSGGNGKKIDITPEQRVLFEKRMKKIWEQRQEEIKNFQKDHLADLPQLLKDRIASIREYIEDPITELRSLDLDKEEETGGGVSNILEVLQDLEYQLTDVDMARDFYTLGGWPLLSSLLADAIHDNVSISNSTKTTTSTEEATMTDEDWNKVNLIQAHAAWTIGTSVKNTGEFYPYATVEIEVLHQDKNDDDEKRTAATLTPSVVKTTALDLVLAQFVSSSRTILDNSLSKGDNNMYYDSVMMKVHKALYALGALLRGNRQAQTHFCADQGPALLASILSQLADKAAESNNNNNNNNNKDGVASLPRDFLKVVQRLLSLAQDIVMDVTLHPTSSSTQVDDAIAKAFTTPSWCNTMLRFLPIPRLYETTLLTIQQLAPHCTTTSGGGGGGGGGGKTKSWDNIQEIVRQIQRPPPQVTKAWLPEDLDEDLKDERMKLLKDTIKAVQRKVS